MLIMLEGLFMSTTLIVTAIYGESDQLSFIISVVSTIFSGFVIWFLTRSKKDEHQFGLRDSFLIVTLAWLLISLFGAEPYLISRSIPRFVDAFFESVSGFTTTGSSILTDIEVLPHGILYWRSMTHWIGGMGIIVLAVAILPFLRIEGVFLFNNEASSILADKLHPRITSVAKRLWFIYLIMTLAETILLWMGDMNLFDAICHSFATVATGGFSTKNTSIADYSSYAQYVIIVFMILSGMNFSLHYFMIRGQFRKVRRNEEVKFYLGIIFVVSLIICIQLINNLNLHFEEAFRRSLFQVSSVMTATGFATDDYLKWPQISWLLIFLIMFVGASSGSTGGGVKVIRHVFLFKRIRNSIRNHIYPNAVFPLKINGKLVDEKTVHNVMTFIYLYFITFVIGTIFMSGIGLDVHTAMGAVITTMGGIGPGIGRVGPSGNFGFIPDAGKYFLDLMMILGRLEIFTVLVLFTPGFWKE